MRILTSIRKHWPRRRRRLWQYVSGRRHRVGMALFALVILVTYGWWYFTNDRRVEKYAEAYLQRLTGAEVRIGKAEFSLSQGIKLSDVRAFFRERGRKEDLFQAREVYLRQEPLSLLTGSPRVSEVTCIEPVLMLLQERNSNQWRAQGFFGRGGAANPASYAGSELPLLRFRSARVRFETAAAGETLPIGVTPPMNILATPDPGTRIYTFTIEQVNPQTPQAIKGQGFFNVLTQETSVTGWLPLEGLDTAMPQRYRQWYDQHKITGDLSLSFEKNGSSSSQLVVRLANVSMELPPEEGGVALSDIKGQIAFDSAGVSIEHLEGQLPQSGGSVVVQGRYDGYDADGAFDIGIECDRLEFPLPLRPQGALGPMAAELQAALEPQGAAAISVELSREAGGKLDFAAKVHPQKMSVRPTAFPYRLEDVQGEIELAKNELTVHKLTGRHGATQVTVDGKVLDPLGAAAFDIAVNVRDLALDEDMLSALPNIGKNAWKDFSPEGLCNVSIQARRRAGETLQASGIVQFDGRAAVTYAEFPYRADQLIGTLTITNEGISVNDVAGYHGDSRLMLSGVIKHDSDGWHTDVRLTGKDVPLNDELAVALPQRARESYLSFHPSGATDIDGQFTRPPGGPTLYNFSTTLRDTSLRYDGFPYELQKAQGVLRFTPDRAYVEHLAGVHGSTAITVKGQVLLDRQPAGVDMSFVATDMALDQPLYAALPPEVAEIWNEISPSGTTDLAFELRPGAAGGGHDYRLVLAAKNMGVRYAKFPYPVRNLKGEVTAVPGRVELKNLTSVDRDATLSASGVVTIGSGGSKAELTIAAKNLPVDGRMVASIPAELKTLVGTLSPGGQCDLDIRQLKYTAPGGKVVPQWVLDGQLGLRSVSFMGVRNVTGAIDGRVECNSRGDFGAIQAEINLAEAVLQNRRLVRVLGTAEKAADSPLVRVDDFSAEAYGGRMAGFAEFTLTRPNQYGLNLTVENISIDDLLNAGDPSANYHGLGRLAGSLEMMGTVGQNQLRQASGVMNFRDAQTYKLPVMWGLLDIALLQMPGDSMFHQGNLSYHMKGNVLNLQEVYLSGLTTSLLGSGTVRLPDEQIHLTFVSGPSKLVPSLLSQLMQITSKGLFHVRVTGTLHHPVVETRPLGDMNDLLREMVTSR